MTNARNTILAAVAAGLLLAAGAAQADAKGGGSSSSAQSNTTSDYSQSQSNRETGAPACPTGEVCPDQQ